MLYLGDQETDIKASSGNETYKGLYVKLRFDIANPTRTRQFLEGTVSQADLIADAGMSRLALAKAYYLIGLVHMAEGRPGAARESLAKVVEQGQITWPIHYVARLLCERIGDQ